MKPKSGLAAIARADARILILGSLPGDASLAVSQYYAHPRNHFWALLSNVIGQNLASMCYADRIDAVQQAKIALWDVVGRATRKGSLDQHIRDVRTNDLVALARQLPELQAVAFNGQKAAILGVKIFRGTQLDLIHLPSSSPAYTLGFADKYVTWSQLSRYLSPGSSIANDEVGDICD